MENEGRTPETYNAEFAENAEKRKNSNLHVVSVVSLWLGAALQAAGVRPEA